MPAAQHDNFRIMRVFPTAIHRLGLNGGQELNGSVLAKVFQTALEVRESLVDLPVIHGI